MRFIYFDIDSLRPDHLCCYGYHRNTSPNIDRIASEGMRFGRFYCSDAPCLPSRAAMTTARFGIHNGIVNHGGTAADRPPEGPNRSFTDSLSNGGSFVSLLRQAGLYTCYIGGFPERHSAYWYYSGFREFHDTGKGGLEIADDVTPLVLDWISNEASRENWYLHVNYWDPHTPYRTPVEWGNPFERDPLPEWMTEETLRQHWKMAGPHSAQDFGGMWDNRIDPNLPRQPGEVHGLTGWREVIDGYDSGVSYVDNHIGRILAALDEQGVLDDLIIAVSSDHGENLGELGIYGEHATADEFTCHLPFIIRWPGKVQAGSISNQFCYSLDLAPTMADMLGQPHKPYWDGQSFSGILTGQQQGGYDQLILSQCSHVCQRSVRWEDWIYIRTYHDGFHLFPREQLYDLASDPHEEHDLAGDHPELCYQGAWRLMDWHDRMMSSMPPGRVMDPMRIVLEDGGPHHTRGALRPYLDRLKASGRGEAAEELKRRHPEEFIPGRE